MLLQQYFFLVLLAVVVTQQQEYSEQSAAEFLGNKYEMEMSALCTEARLVEWDYATDIKDENQQKMVEAQTREADYIKTTWAEIKKYNWKEFKNPSLKRQFNQLSTIGTAALPTKEFTQFKNNTSSMESIYGKATICNKGKCNLHLDPEITEIMAKSRNYDELLHVWTEWHNAAGKPMKELYPEYVELSNKAAKENNFENMALLWLNEYETDKFDEIVQNLWRDLKPLYENLHAFVRRRLSEAYQGKVSLKGPIPAHLLGNMWAQSWENIEQIVIPFPNKPSADATPAMNTQGYTAIKMFNVSNEFYMSLGLESVPDSFWNLSMFVRPEGKEVVCHASAWDFCDRKDVRIKMCTKVNMEDFITIHHEMGHTQYFQQYKSQPFTFRDGANPGFHEAIGDTMALSVGTPSHLNKIGLLPDFTEVRETEINNLMRKALQKIAFLPFGLVADAWRWKVFKGEIKESEYNAKWWELRKEYQGIEPAVPRGEEYFDPGAKYHIAADVEYLRYFVAHVLQFQFHKALCVKANRYDPKDPKKPLHKCDIYQDREAGKLFSEMLALGRSRPWPETLKLITGSEKMDVSAILEYFKPLQDYLVEENTKRKEILGWPTDSSGTLMASIAAIAAGVLLALL